MVTAIHRPLQDFWVGNIKMYFFFMLYLRFVMKMKMKHREQYNLQILELLHILLLQTVNLIIKRSTL